MHCGGRLKYLIEQSGISKGEFAAKIERPPQTLSGWFNDYDIKLDNIRDCCKVLNIQLWEFFLEDDNKIPTYVTLGLDEMDVKIINKIKKLPKEKGDQ